MSISDLFWLFFIITAIQPILARRWLEQARLRLLARLERNRGSRVIALIHRQETMSLLGFPVFRYIDIDDSEEVLRAIRLTPDEMPIDLILHTPGGLVLAAEQIALALREHQGKVTVFIPHYAMSGGTLVALAAEQIVMDPHAVLGPVDPQLGQYPASSIVKVLGQKPIQEVDDQTVILADGAEKALRQVRSLVAAGGSYAPRGRGPRGHDTGVRNVDARLPDRGAGSQDTGPAGVYRGPVGSLQLDGPLPSGWARAAIRTVHPHPLSRHRTPSRSQTRRVRVTPRAAGRPTNHPGDTPAGAVRADRPGLRRRCMDQAPLP